MTAESAGIANQSQPSRQFLLGQVTRPLRDFLDTESGSAFLLLGAALVALVWANSPLSDSYESLWNTVLSIELGDHGLTMDLEHWVNDGLMAVFFLVIGLEMRRELSIGELRQKRKIILPLAGALGGLLIPAALYLLVSPDGDARNGWGIVIGTDTAFLFGALALAGPRFPTQLRVLLLAMTIADDMVAVTIIGVVYSDSIDLVALAVAFGALGAIALMGRLGFWRILSYGIALIVLWVATIESGLHASIAGVAGGLLIPAFLPRREDVDRAVRQFRRFRQSPMPAIGYSAGQDLRRAVSVNERLQVILHPWTSYLIVPVFALANSGVDLRGGLLQEALSSPVMWGVVLGLVVGKPIGISLALLTGTRLGIGSLPPGVGRGQVIGGGALSGIGFTVSLLIVSLAFESQQLQDEARVGVLLAAVLSFIVGWAVFRLAEMLQGEVRGLSLTLSEPVDPERDHIQGPVDAPLTLVEYTDFQCPFCAAATGAIRDLRERFGDDLRYVVRHLPLAEVHPDAELAAEAAEAAGAQGRFWEMHDLLFQHQDDLQLENLIGYAATLGLDVDEFSAALGDRRFAERIRDDVASAEESGARGTPTFFVGGRRHRGPHDAVTLAGALVASRLEVAALG